MSAARTALVLGPSAPDAASLGPALGGTAWALDAVRAALREAGLHRILVLAEPAERASFSESETMDREALGEALLKEPGSVLVVDAAHPLLRPQTLQAFARASVPARLRLLRTPGRGATTVAAVIDSSLLLRGLIKVDAAPTNVADLVRRLGGAAKRTTTQARAGEGRRVTTLREALRAMGVLRARRVERLAGEGVVIEDPATCHIGPEVVLAAGALVRPFTLLEGKTTVAAGASIGPFARLVDVHVGPSASILDHCFLRECTVESGASVGPFAHIRPETVIRENAKVGNFVELKKTDLGRGSKAPHLSYIGDATVGEKVNIGAGTITCNYDGTFKHPTRIADGAFVGSNSTLVAPVTVGAGAYVAAGSVITENVPKDAVAFGRARQTLKEGHARTLRERAAAKKAEKH